MRPARVVLEAGKRSPDAGVELALEQDVTDHPPLTGDGFEREKPDSRQVRAVKVTVRAAEQLVAAADGEDRRARLRRCDDPVALGGDVVGDQRLLTVLAAADVQQIVRGRIHGVSNRQPAHVELVAAPSSAPRQHGDVSAVCVDVQVVRIEVPADRRHAARSQ